MWLCKILTLFFLASSGICNVSADSDPHTIGDLLKEETLDKDNHNLVNDIAHFVVTKIEEASKAVGANGVLDPVKLQEYVTVTLSKGTEWLADKTGSLYSKIRDRVTQWWNSMQTKAGSAANQEEISEEVKREVVRTILKQIEEQLRAKKITGIEEKDLEKWVMPQVKKLFGDIFGFPVKVEKEIKV